MKKEEIDKLFNDFLWRMDAIEPVDEKLKIKLQIAFQEGVIKAQEYITKKFNQ